MSDIYDNLKNTPLIEAVKTGQLETVKELIASGVDVNESGEQGWTPLNWAAGQGHLEIVKLLVANGADLFKVGRDRRTPYMIALAASRVETARHLREMEDRAPGEKPARPERKYCKAYQLKDLRQYPKWSESKLNWKNDKKADSDDKENDIDTFSEDDVVFLHQDYIVTQSIWHDENVIFNQMTSDWVAFCTETLKFKAPDDLDLIVSDTTSWNDESADHQSAGR
jgi:uncharacterized protein